MSSALLPTTTPCPQSRPGDPPWEIALLFPQQGAWTEAEYLELSGQNRMVELSNGCLEVLPVPTIIHQLIVEFLHAALKAFVTQYSAGLVLFSPCPIRLWPGEMREPDIFFLRPGRIPADLRDPPDGVDLAMEVVSPDGRKRDLEIKRQVYAQARIPEYWIVDPREQQITVLTLDGAVYREHGVFGPGTQATSVLLPGFTVSVDAVFAAGRGPTT